MAWFERKVIATYRARIGVEADTQEEADAKIIAHEYDEFDDTELTGLEFTSETKKVTD